MITRIAFAAVLLATPVMAQTATRPKVVATPAPAAPSTPKPVRKRPVQKSPATLIAEYTRSVKLVLSSKWQDTAPALVNQFTSGALSISFKVDAEGKVTDYKVVTNISNEALAAFCEELVKSCSFEKPPARALTDGQLEIPFNFSIL